MKREIDYKKIHSFDDLLDAKYGTQGEPDRDLWEQEYEKGPAQESGEYANGDFKCGNGA